MDETRHPLLAGGEAYSKPHRDLRNSDIPCLPLEFEPDSKYQYDNAGINQMLLNGGELDGKRCLSDSAVKQGV